MAEEFPPEERVFWALTRLDWFTAERLAEALEALGKDAIPVLNRVAAGKRARAGAGVKLVRGFARPQAADPVRPQIVHHGEADIPAEGVMFIHCSRCLEELPSYESPESYARLTAAWTRRGIQIWCVRHNINVDNAVIEMLDET